MTALSEQLLALAACAEQLEQGATVAHLEPLLRRLNLAAVAKTFCPEDWTSTGARQEGPPTPIGEIEVTVRIAPDGKTQVLVSLRGKDWGKSRFIGRSTSLSEAVKQALDYLADCPVAPLSQCL